MLKETQMVGWIENGLFLVAIWHANKDLYCTYICYVICKVFMEMPKKIDVQILKEDKENRDLLCILSELLMNDKSILIYWYAFCDSY